MPLREVRASFLAVLLAGIAPAPSARAAEDGAAQVRHSVDAWMDCDECTDAQRRRVVEAGQAAVPILIEYLRDGPPPQKRELFRRQLTGSYRSLKEYEERHPRARLAMSEDEYVATYLANHTARYQVRAAAALAEIGGAQARAAIEAALQKPVRDDVKTSLSRALQQMKGR